MAQISVPIVLLGVQVAPSAGAAAPYSGPKLSDVQKSRDYIHGGAGRIDGFVEEKGTPNAPLRRKVRLHRDVDGLMVRETWSDASTGAYEFTNINPAYTYTAIAYDYARNHRAEAADGLLPEVRP
jgi:hypothetical protein